MQSIEDTLNELEAEEEAMQDTLDSIGGPEWSASDLERGCRVIGHCLQVIEDSKMELFDLRLEMHSVIRELLMTFLALLAPKCQYQSCGQHLQLRDIVGDLPY